MVFLTRGFLRTDTVLRALPVQGGASGAPICVQRNIYRCYIYPVGTARVCVPPRGSTAVITAPTGSPRAGPGNWSGSRCQEILVRARVLLAQEIHIITELPLIYQARARGGPADLDLCLAFF